MQNIFFYLVVDLLLANSLCLGFICNRLHISFSPWSAP